MSKLRGDGRTPSQASPLSFERDFTEMALGSVLVSFGRTRELCTASVEEEARRGATLVSLVATALGRCDASGYRSVLLGGAAPPAALPPTVVTTYGMTETGSGCVYDGHPLDELETRFEAIDDGRVALRLAAAGAIAALLVGRALMRRRPPWCYRWIKPRSCLPPTREGRRRRFSG